MGKRRRIVVAALVLAALIGFYWSWRSGVLPWQRTSNTSAPVLVLEDCDSDFRTPPFEDAVIRFGPNGKPVRKVNDLNICETVGGCRSLAVATDGRFFTVCENVGNRLTAYQLDTGQRLWSLQGGSLSSTDFTAAVVAPSGTVYALASRGTIFGYQALAVDAGGRIIRQAPVGGFDLALDPDRGVLWLVGKTVKKCDLELNFLLEIKPIHWCAVSVDYARDGSIWVAERDHPNVPQSTNRIIKMSPAGQIIKSVGLAFSPLCVRVDRSDGSAWVTGWAVSKSASQRVLESIEKRTGHLPTGKWLRDWLSSPNIQPTTLNYDANGVLRQKISQGGFTLDLDQADGSVWIVGRDRVYHYSRQGTQLGQFKGLSSHQKYIAVIPQEGEPGK